MKRSNIQVILENILFEGRVKTSIDKWSNYVVPGHEDLGPLKNQDGWDDVVRTLQAPENDPSGNNKYLDFMFRYIVQSWTDALNGDEDNFDIYTDYIVRAVKIFHNLSERNLIEDKNIYSPKYKDFTVFSDVITKGQQRAEEIQKEKQFKSDAEKIYQDSRWIVVVPKTHEASCHYGAGTKWCTTTRGITSYFESYTTNGILFYILDKTRTSGTLYKLAIHAKYKEGRQVYDVGNDLNFLYQPLEAYENTMTGYDEEDLEVNLKYIIPLLPKSLMDAIQSYYFTNLNNINRVRRENAYKKALEREGLEEKRVLDMKTVKLKFLEHVLEEGHLDNFIDVDLDGSYVELNQLTKVFGEWKWVFLEGNKRFHIVSNRVDFYIEGLLFPDQETDFTLKLYRIDEGGVYTPIGDTIGFNSNALFFITNNPFGMAFYNETKIKIDVIDVIENQELIGLFLTTLRDKIEKYCLTSLFRGGVPTVNNKVLWKPKNDHSSYKFTYPARPNSITYKFLEYVMENPGRTAVQFYRDVLGKRRTVGHNAMFFGSIKDAGLVTMRRQGREFGYYIGPNYKAWTEGRLQRI